MDGSLLAIIVQCDDSYLAMSIDDITTTLGAENSLASQFLYRYGMKAEPLANDDLRAYFEVEQGIWVSELWKGYPAQAAGVMSGDLLVALNGVPVAILQDLEPLTRPGPDTVFELQVRRGAQTVSVSIPGRGNQPAASGGDSTAEGIFLGNTEAGYRIESVEAGSAAALAGIRPGDRLLQVGNTAVTGPPVLRSLLTAPNRGPLLAIADRGPKTVALLLK